MCNGQRTANGDDDDTDDDDGEEEEDDNNVEQNNKGLGRVSVLTDQSLADHQYLTRLHGNCIQYILANSLFIHAVSIYQ